MPDITRAALTTLNHTPTAKDTHTYSRFKHGDTRAADRYGHALGRLYLAQPNPPAHVTVTSSGYSATPPAAAALLPAFLSTIHTHQRHTVTRIHRTNTTDGDYAKMTNQDRRTQLTSKQLHLHHHRTGHYVVLDDIRVTGTHEEAVQQALTRAGADHIYFLYILDATPHADAPQIEHFLNQTGVPDTETLLHLTRQPGFHPNARVTKRILQLPRPEQTHLLRHAPGHLANWLQTAARRDGLHHKPAYQEGFDHLTWLCHSAT